MRKVVRGAGGGGLDSRVDARVSGQACFWEVNSRQVAGWCRVSWGLQGKLGVVGVWRWCEGGWAAGPVKSEMGF